MIGLTPEEEIEEARGRAGLRRTADPKCATGCVLRLSRDTSPPSPLSARMSEMKHEKKYTLFQASAFNTLNMFGTGPFITIPFVLQSTFPAGPHALFGYILSAIACGFDSFIWAELGSRWPMSGGSYVYLLEIFPQPYGRLMAFLYCWQFLITANMEIASGFVAIAQYMSYITDDDNYWRQSALAASLCAISVALLYQGVEEIGRVTAILWAFTVGSIVFCLVIGFSNFQSAHFEAPEHAFSNIPALLIGIGTAARYGVYDFTGYYDVCQMGGEVANPRKNIPIACIGTCWCVMVIYFLVYTAVLGALPLDVIISEQGQKYVMAVFCEKLLNESVASVFVIIVSLCIFGANFAMMCGGSYVPYAAARGGHFFSFLGHRHPTRDGLADYSLLLMGLLSIFFCFFRLDYIIQLMMTLMIVVQFMGQSVGLLLLRSGRATNYRKSSIVLRPSESSENEEEFRVPYAQVICGIQLSLFGFALFSSPPMYLLFAVSVIAGGSLTYIAWTKYALRSGPQALLRNGEGSTDNYDPENVRYATVRDSSPKRIQEV